MQRYILVLDEGTTGTKAFVVDENAKIVSSGYREISLITNELGYAELNGEEIFEKSVAACKEAMEKAGIEANNIAAMAIDFQRCSMLAWDRSGCAYKNCISWQDSRINYLSERAKRDGMLDYVRCHLGRSKVSSGVNLICWMAENYPEFREKLNRGELLYGGIDSWLLYKLTGGRTYATSVDGASLCGMIDFETLQPAGEYLRWLGLPATGLPEVKNNNDDFGMTDKSIFGAEIPILSVIADQHAAVYAQRAFNRGDVKCTLGTGAFIDITIGDKAAAPKSAYSNLLAWRMNGQCCYISECYVAAVGTFQRWIKSLFRFSDYGEIGALAESVSSSGGVYCLPTILGMLDPVPDFELRGVFAGISAATGKGEIMRASLEGLAFLNKYVMCATTDDMGISIRSLRVDGGMARSETFCRLLADVLNAEVIKPDEVELTAVGAAQIGGIRAGLWDDAFLRKNRLATVVSPTDRAAEYEKKYSRWCELLDSVKEWTHKH